MNTNTKAFHIKELRTKLAQVNVPSYVSVDNHGKFYFELMSSVGVRQLADCLSRLDTEDTNLEQWLLEALPSGLNVVGIRENRNAGNIGFVTYEMMVHLKHYEDDHTIHVKLTLLPNAIYVTPTARGRGVGDAIAKSLAYQLQRSLEQLRGFANCSTSAATVADLRVGLEAECISTEGARMTQKIFMSCAAAVEEFREPTDSWPGLDRLNEYVDWFNWPPECDLNELYEAKSGRASPPIF